jgi:hypothetical protein
MIPISAKTETVSSALAATQPNAAWQFRISSLLWLTFTAAMTLAYARLFGNRAMLVMTVTPLVALAIGGGMGSFSGRIIDAVYWATVGAVLGATCVVAAPVNELTLCFWPLLGAITGGYTGAIQPKVTFITLLKSVAVSVVLIGLFHQPFGMGGNEFLLTDLTMVPVVAVGLAGLVRLVDWLRATYHTSRDAWAAGLVVAVISGNLWAALVAGRLGQ